MTDPAKIKSLLRQLATKNHKTDKYLPVIDKGSPQWQAWRGWYNRYGLYQSDFIETQQRMTVPCEWPPENEAELEEMLGSKVRLAR